MRATFLFFAYTACITIIVGIFLYVFPNSLLKQYVIQNITGTTAPLCKDCNVILISIDTLSALHLPCYGYTRNTSPNLCEFARKNVWFPNSYAQSYFTLPSHFSIFTSLYPSTHGMLKSRANSLDPTHKMLTEVLHTNGYSTLYFGPVDSIQLPLDKGLGRGFDYKTPSYSYAPDDPTLNIWKRGIDMFKENQKQGKKTFLFLHTYYVHQPYLPMTRNLHFTKDYIADMPVTSKEYFSLTPDYIRFVKENFKEEPLDTPVDSSVYELYNRFLSSTDETESMKLYDELTDVDCSDFCITDAYYYGQHLGDKRKVAYMKALYDEQIFNLDTQMKHILKLLEPELRKNTILIITADHGEGFMEHDSLGHSLLYNEVLRVPLIMSIPHALARKVETPVEGIDIYPTILRFLGIHPPTTIEGVDVTKHILGQPFVQGRPYIISDMFGMVQSSQSAYIPQRQETIINNKWKLYIKDVHEIDNPKFQELYDAKNDPWDAKNVASIHPTEVQTLLNQLKPYLQTHLISYPPAPTSPTILPEKQTETQRYIHY